ncbi:copper ion binding protein [Elusimicrobium posterum]
MEKRIFNITGMTCSACSARVEKAVAKMDGVKEVSVNLLKNTMSVTFDAAVTNTQEIIKKVEDTGYGATLQNAKKEQKPGAEKTAAQQEAASLKRRLIISAVFTVPLFYIAMGEMLSLPLPAVFGQNPLIFAFTQFLLALPVIFVNNRYFSVGLKNLFKLSPNMDSLIALGSGAAFVYGIYAIYKIAWAMGAGDMAIVHKFSMNLYFESAAMILTLITLGKFLEARAKNKTSEAITKLMNLTPKTATILREGKEEVTQVEDVLAGDILIVKAGDTVPVDGIIEEGRCFLDESAITGESLPVEKL